MKHITTQFASQTKFRLRIATEVASRPTRAVVDSLNATEQLQFIQNRLNDNENKLSAIRQLQCESRKF